MCVLLLRFSVIQYEEGLDSMTSSADALKMFKASIGGEDEFRRMFRSHIG